ncbi:PE-PPE domain-containing protein [Gordonia sp. VNK21]|uniref:PE-PPE domain-containing protein n=1 Tax=Gordonia sp. VNK21 TaxID=3382483 RepID=UPI0038D43AA0
MSSAQHHQSRRGRLRRHDGTRPFATRAAAAVAAVLAVAVAVVLPGGVAMADDDECGTGAAIVVAGTNDPDAIALRGVSDRYRDDGYRVINVSEDPADYATTLWPLGSVGYDDDVAKGTAATYAALEEYQAACAGRPVAIIGYSQGARIAGDVLNGLATDTDGSVTGPDGREYAVSKTGVSGTLYSDPRRDGPESSRGVELALPGIVPGLTLAGARPGGFGDIPVTTYCWQSDGICDLADPLHDPLGALDSLVGFLTTRHGMYPRTLMQHSDADNLGQPGTEPICTSITTVGNTTTCFVDDGSAMGELGATLAGSALGLVGLTLDDVVLIDRDIDLYASLRRLLNVNGVLPHADLGDLQQYLAPILNVLPPLPYIGYAGAHVPDLLAVADLLTHLVTLDGDGLRNDAAVFGGSALSFLKAPFNAAAYRRAQLSLVRDQRRLTPLLDPVRGVLSGTRPVILGLDECDSLNWGHPQTCPAATTATAAGGGSPDEDAAPRPAAELAVGAGDGRDDHSGDDRSSDDRSGEGNSGAGNSGEHDNPDGDIGDTLGNNGGNLGDPEANAGDDESAGDGGDAGAGPPDAGGEAVSPSPDAPPQAGSGASPQPGAEPAAQPSGEPAT